MEQYKNEAYIMKLPLKTEIMISLFFFLDSDYE